MNFSYESFGQLIDRIVSAGYAFRRLDEARKTAVGERTFYLRHDVDISPRSALRMGAISAGKGAPSSYFFQLNAETYNIFRPDTLATMRELRSMGHCVGLHIDRGLFGDSEEAIANTMTWFSQTCAPLDRAVSFHRPAPDVLGRQYSSFQNAYAPNVFHPDRYAADSRRSLGFVSKVDDWLRGAVSPVQLLLHPEWWYPHDTVQNVWEDLRDRRQWELGSYAVENFRKVFGQVITPGKDRFGI